MARRLNTKLLAILGAAIVVVVVGSIVAHFGYKRHVGATAARDARAFYEKGQYAEATELFPKAVRRRQFANDIDLMLTASDAHAKIEVSNFTEASKNMGHRIEWLKRAILVDPQDGRALQERLDLSMRLGRDAGHRSAWDNMYNQTDQLIKTYPNLILAIKYRGIAQVNRMQASTTNVSEDERKQARNDLEVAINDVKFFDDAEIAEYLAIWFSVEANIAKRNGATEKQVEAMREEGLAISQASIEDHPDSVERLMAHIQLLLRCERPEQTLPHITHMESLLNTQNDLDPRAIARALRYLLVGVQLAPAEGTEEQRQARRTEKLDLASAICRQAIDAHPGASMTLKVILADLYVQQGRTEDAVALCEQVWESSLQSPSMDFFLRSAARAQGGLAQLRLRMSQIEAMEAGEEQRTQLDQIETVLKEVKARLGTIPTVTLVEAQIAGLRGERVREAELYNQVIDIVGATDQRTLIRSAQARLKLGDWGAAAENFEQALRIRPDNIRVRMAVAQLYMRGKKLEKSREHLEVLLADKWTGEDDMLKRMELEFRVRDKDYDRADELLEAFDITAYVDTAANIAMLLHGDNKKKRAIDIMTRTFSRYPNNTSAALRLIQITEDEEQQLAILEQCREAGGDATTLDMIQSQIDESFEMDTARDDELSAADDTTAKAMEQYQDLVDNNKRRKAGETLTAQIDFDQPENAGILWKLFRDRIAKEDWKSAEQLATLARDALGGVGADMAEGRFFLGHLNVAQGNHEAAVRNLRAGLEMRRIFSTGWRLLGEALLATQEVDPAIDAFETALQQKPSDVQTLLGLAAARDQRGETAAALAALKSANDYQPYNYRVKDAYLRYQLQHGNPVQAITMRREIQEKNPSNMANRQALVRALLATENIDDAVAELKLIIEEEGETLDNLILAADVVFETHGVEMAVDQLSGYIKKLEGDATLEDYVRIARKLMELNQEDAAFSVYRQAMTIEDPELRPVTRELAGRLLGYPDRIPEAVELFEDLWHSSDSDMQIGVAYVQALLQNEELAKAESMLEILTAADPENASVRVLKDQIASAGGDRSGAIDEIKQAIAKTPNRAMLHMALAELLIADAAGRDQALVSLDRALELNPMLTEAQRLKAAIYATRGEYNTAIREYESLVRSSPQLKQPRLALVPLYQITGQVAALKDLLAKSEAAHPADSHWPREQARVAVQEGELGTALKKMDRAFALETSPEILFDLVRLQLQTDKPNEALATLRGNMSLIEDQHLLQALRGRAILMTQSRREAIEVFRVALMLTDNLDELTRTATQIVPALNFKGTAKLVDDAFESPRPVWVDLCIGNLEQRAADHDGAVMRLMPLESQVAELNEGERAFYYQTYALALHMTNQFEEARTAYQMYLDLQPRNPMMLNNLAYIVSEHLNDPQAGIAFAEEAIEMQPNNPMILDTLGRACYLADDHDRALGILQQAADLQETGMTCLHLAQVLIKLNREPQAVEWLHKAQKLATREHDTETRQKAEALLNQLNPS